MDEKAPPDTNTQEWRDYQRAVGAKPSDPKPYTDPSTSKINKGLGAKSTGRGMRPGETVAQWKARIAAEDSTARDAQEKALKEMGEAGK